MNKVPTIGNTGIPAQAMIKVVQPLTSVITVTAVGDALGTTQVTLRIQQDMYRPTLRLTNVLTMGRSPIRVASKAIAALEWDGNDGLLIPPLSDNCDPFYFLPLGVPIIRSGTDVVTDLTLFTGAVATSFAQVALVGYRKVSQIGEGPFECSDQKMLEANLLPVIPEERTGATVLVGARPLK